MIGDLRPATDDHREALEKAIALMNECAEEVATRLLELKPMVRDYTKGVAAGYRAAASRLTCLMNEGH